MIFLRLKHWQLFSVSWGPLSLFFIVLSSDSDSILAYFKVFLLLFLMGLTNSFIWAWMIVAKLISKAPSMNFSLFRIVFWIPCVYCYVFIFYLLYNLFIHKTTDYGFELEFMIGGGCLSVVCIFFGLAFIGKLIKAATIERIPTFREHVPESVMMLFPPLGLWLIQPKLNRLVEGRTQVEQH